jgi:hypothetical protein
VENMPKERIVKKVFKISQKEKKRKRKRGDMI